jgi:D-threonate/D-erythronate kinase
MQIEARSPDFVRPTFADPHSGRIVLLADDLTGACDGSAAFLRSGRTARVWFGTSVQFSTPESVQAFNTSSRKLSSRRAAHAVSQACAALGNDPNALFFKKVDSAAGGPIAAELLAAHRALGTRAILFAPAFPTAGRTVSDGVLGIEDAAGKHSRVRLNSLFPIMSRGRIFNVSHARELAPALEDSGKTILICDSATQADLDALARAAADLPDLLFAGSAGLAQALAGLIPARPMTALVPPAARTLLVAGTSHPVTKLQLQTLGSVDDEAVRILRLHLSFGAAARIRSAFSSFAPQALILTGGETAELVVRALDAHSFIIQGEFMPGIPWGTVQGGDAHGCTVVTKSGGFGAPNALNQILAALRGRA